jgi:hypothetical protein
VQGVPSSNLGVPTIFFKHLHGRSYLYRSRQTGAAFIGEIVGGGVGGAAGGLLPDLIEPAIHSWHRSTAHGAAAATALGITATRAVPHWPDLCRTNAARHDALHARATDLLSSAWHAFMAFLWRFFSGFAAGLPAGYLSHLAMDARTPRCIPLLA